MGKKREVIYVMSAHSDDYVIGAGGTIAHYAQEKKQKVIALVLSYGEKSHPWIKEKIIQKTRSEEAFEASKILHCETIFFDLKEFGFLKGYTELGVDTKILEMMKKNPPTKIFTHSTEDPHPDHKATHQITLDIVNRLQNKPEVYIYSVWNPVSFKTQYPSLYVNISSHFKTKLQALKSFRSQKFHIIYPSLMLFYRALKDGLKMRKKFGEHFFRIQ